jgi:iron complex transport system substrate-binding protein
MNLRQRRRKTVFPPQRIVCLTEETIETLYLLGEDARIVGVSGFAQRPPQVRKEKPRVSAFTSADIDGIAALSPDLVLTYSDLQADIAAQLIRCGIAVHAFTHHDLAGILAMIRMLGALVGAAEKADALARSFEERLAAMAADAGTARPRVFFEEWSEPIITGSHWVSELIAIAGGADVFSDKAKHQAAKERFVTPEEVVAAAPDIIIGSWCGKQFKPDQVKARPGFGAIPAVQRGRLHEINSTLILQPGPAALTDGLDALRAIIAGGEAKA